MIETRGAAVYKKKISKCKNRNLKEEKACTEKMGKKQVCRSDKKSDYKKVSCNEKDVACGSKRKSFSVRDSEEEKGKKKIKQDGNAIPSSGDNTKVCFDFFLNYFLYIFSCYFVFD